MPLTTEFFPHAADHAPANAEALWSLYTDWCAQTNANPVELAVKLLGGPVQTARLLKLKGYQTVQHWVRQGMVPAEYCPVIETELHGAVTCEQLRPSVPWSLIRHPSTNASPESLSGQANNPAFVPSPGAHRVQPLPRDSR